MHIRSCIRYSKGTGFYRRVEKMTRFTVSRCSHRASLYIFYTRALLKRCNLLRLRRIYLFSISVMYMKNKNVVNIHPSIYLARYFTHLILESFSLDASIKRLSGSKRGGEKKCVTRMRDYTLEPNYGLQNNYGQPVR